MSTHQHELILRRTVHVSLDQLWSAWADPAELAKWFTDQAEQDFRVGGRYQNSDGDRGEFLEIVPKAKLVFTWEQPDYAPGGIVSLHFRQLSEEASELLLHHTNISCDDEADLNIAWNWGLDSLVAYLEESEQLDYQVWAAGRGL
ncbi:MAG: SRPBCC domain-containing protein [Ignavibacteriae bacterium]|nr:SRPBCC domain-containing protein [Ignavibacteriota bacterium]